MECWNIGKLEYWVINRDQINFKFDPPWRIKTHHSNIPPFQYSAGMNPVSCRYKEILPSKAKK